MNSTALSLPIADSRIWAVPAVHFRYAFADGVNRLCSDPAVRPDAIAVELGPHTAAAAYAWLRELVGVNRELPCMLGLIRANRCIRASLRLRAIQLQEVTGKDLNELPPELLKAVLGYSTVTTLYLSPVDSIIEAIRCALELQVPLYGVDLDESAEAMRIETLIEDPLAADGPLESLAGYVERNAEYAAEQRDEEIDSRRETAMAARLKTLLSRHRRVVFTGGLAHWTRLRGLLEDDRVRAAPVSAAADLHPTDFRRVLVHPLLAVRHMDIFPTIVTLYEQIRPSVTKSRTVVQRITPATAFAAILQQTYKEHFSKSVIADKGDRKERSASAPQLSDSDSPQDAGSGVEQLDRVQKDFEARLDFERLLTNLCVVGQTNVPDLFTSLMAAEGVMSRRFCERFSKNLMHFDWVPPNDPRFASLPTLRPAPTEAGDFQRAELVWPNGEHGRHFFIDARPGAGSYKVHVNIPWQWEDGPGNRRKERFSHMYVVWPPTTYLHTAMSFRAMQISDRHRHRTLVERFEGSLRDGLDVKATLRAQAKGNDEVFVRDVRYRRQPKSSRSNEWDPIVWLFRLGNFPGADWDFLGELVEEFVEFANDKRRMRDVIVDRQLGPVMIEQVGFGRRILPHDFAKVYGRQFAKRAGDCITQCLEWQGLLMYTPCHFLVGDNAAWAENTEFKRSPFCGYPSFDRPDPYPANNRLFSPPIENMYRERYGLTLNLQDWSTTMIRIAIPFASQSITVVAPDKYLVPDVVYREAARRGIQVRTAPHSYFPAETLRKISLWHGVPTLNGSSGKRMEEAVLRAFDEPPTANSGLLPESWLNYQQAARRT